MYLVLVLTAVAVLAFIMLKKESKPKGSGGSKPSNGSHPADH